MYAWLWIDRYMFAWDVSEAWRLADKSFEFFSKKSNGYTNYLPIEIQNREDLITEAKDGHIKAGDLVYFKRSGKIYHAAIVVDVKVKDGSVYYAGHTTNRRHYNLSKSIGEGVYIVRIKKDAQ